ncbi:MAG: hypothetical protein GWN53_17270 [Gammaproteobacteria bacterium]|nr:hypothetical protein [Gammaproteobacteria bacterium]
MSVVTLDGETSDTTGEVVTLDNLRASDVGIHVRTIDSGEVRFEGSIDGENWSLMQVTNKVDGTTATSTTASGYFVLDAAGLAAVRTPLGSHSTGSVTAVVLPQFD